MDYVLAVGIVALFVGMGACIALLIVDLVFDLRDRFDRYLGYCLAVALSGLLVAMAAVICLVVGEFLQVKGLTL